MSLHQARFVDKHSGNTVSEYLPRPCGDGGPVVMSNNMDANTATTTITNSSNRD
jgi:hypothetical protein